MPTHQGNDSKWCKKVINCSADISNEQSSHDDDWSIQSKRQQVISELKLVTDNLPFSVMQEPTEKPLKNNDAIVPFISEPPNNGIISTVQLVSYEIPQPLQSTWIHSKIFAVIGCSTSIVAIATFSNLISVPVISVPYEKNLFQLFCCTLSTYKLASSPGHDQILSRGSGLGRKLLTSKSKCKSDSFTT